MCIPRFTLRDKVILRLLKLYFNISDMAEWYRAKIVLLQCINGVISSHVEGEQKMCHLKNIILTLVNIQTSIYKYI